MRLSVVIVNYNVKHFLEQCLRSVTAAAEEVRAHYGESAETDIWVVDNNSTDGSVAMVREGFPQVHLIANSDNPGFAKANNQALMEVIGAESGKRKAESEEMRAESGKRKAESEGAENGERKMENGEREAASKFSHLTSHISEFTSHYVLLLNPDTLVQRDTFTTCIDFFESHPDCGGLSVKMVDGEGRYLKESKRGFPSPATSFFKISGLIKLFPHNRKVGAYYMGHLDDNEVNEVDVLPGAFLMLSREALEKTGLLDESYFMYGEDIDFSWRIRLAGFKNYYLPTTRILHYKGESTRKSSMNYVYTFYNAMAIFARKYFSQGGAKTYTLLIQCAIWLRASVDFVKRMLGWLAVPLADFAVSLAGFLAIKQVWATFWAANVNYYPDIYTYLVLPAYVLILLITSWLAGGYDKPIRPGRIVQGMGTGALLLLVFYSLLSEELRFSRAIVLLGSVWSIVAALGIRGLLGLCGVEGYRQRPRGRRRYMVVGSDKETKRLEALFDQLGIEHDGIMVAHDPDDAALHGVLPKVDEVIFCSHDIQIDKIIDILEAQSGKGVDFRILPDGMEVLIGSNYIGSPDSLYTPDFGSIDSTTNRRTKRLFDIASALLIIVLSPILFWPQKRKRRFFADCFAVLFGRKSWVGYCRGAESGKRKAESEGAESFEPLPNIRRGVFRTRDLMPRVKDPDCKRLDRNYATDYRVATDITILMINIFKI